MAHSDYCTGRLSEWLRHVAPVVVWPGEDEMGALAMNALGALRGELPVRDYEGV